MQIGKRYLAVSPAYSFEDIDGQTVQFPERRSEIEVLPKPEQVTVDDGEYQTVERLPDHLKSEDWFLVKNLITNRTHWFNPINYEITLLS